MVKWSLRNSASGQRSSFWAGLESFSPALGRIAFIITIIFLTTNAHTSDLKDMKGGWLMEESGKRFADDGEFLIDTSITYIPAPGNQEYPWVSFDGTNYLVVWQDKRSGEYDI
ncbi:MAG: hypothetical protein ABIK39_06385, partial [candidate division WOR-3 bacterium]